MKSLAPLDGNPRRELTISSKIQSIYSVHTVEQVARVDFLVISSWQERCLQSIPKDSIDWSIVWSPKIGIRNALEIDVVSGDELGGEGTSFEETSGRVKQAQHFRANLAQHFDLIDFPFDSQRLQIILTSAGRSEAM